MARGIPGGNVQGTGTSIGIEAGLVRQDRMGPVVVLVLAHPPGNTLSSAVMAALSQALAGLATDPTLSAVILRGEGRGFCSGADLRSPGQGARMTELGALCRRIEEFPRPVIAALHGKALGAGFALAMAAQYRIAHSATQIGLPEVVLGLLSAAGATQRLPRLAGAEAALLLMLSGQTIGAADAEAMGLIDRVLSENLGEAALAMAGEGLPPRPTAFHAMRNMAGFQAAVAAARAEERGNPVPAAARIIDCVEAAGLLPFDMGLALEQTAFEDLVASPTSHGLRHAYVAERMALQPPVEVAGRPVPGLTAIGVLGAGGPATDLALQAITAGLRVTLCDPDRARLSDALGRIAATQDLAVVAGQSSQDVRDADWARLSSSLDPQSLAGLDLVLVAPGGDATPLDPSLAVALMGAPREGAGLTVPEAAGGLAELAIGPGASVEVILRLTALARRLNWRVVVAGPGGPIELGLRLALEAAEAHLIRVGHAPDTVVAALAAYGMGPATRPLPPMPRGGMALVQTCLAALAAEGARMLGDGRARRPCDIDAVAILSRLMPRWQGGPMYQADQRGLLVLRADLQKLEGQVFAVPQVLDDLIFEGQKFADLDGL